MEATGVYSSPSSTCSSGGSSAGSRCKYLHNVLGRKSDAIDSAWCCQLLEHGLVRPSFLPPPQIRRLRDLTRLCIAQVEERTRVIQRLEKVLQDAGIKTQQCRRGELLSLGAGELDPLVES